MTLVAGAGVEGESQALSRISRSDAPVPSANPKTNDTTLVTRRAVMAVSVLWRMSLRGVYAYECESEYIRHCLIGCSFVAPTHKFSCTSNAGITNIVPIAGVIRVKGAQGVRTP